MQDLSIAINFYTSQNNINFLVKIFITLFLIFMNLAKSFFILKIIFQNKLIICEFTKEHLRFMGPINSVSITK